MSHITVKEGYTKLVDRINRFPQGATPSELLLGILRILFTEEEAGLVSLMPIKPFTAKKAAAIWKKSEAESRKICDRLADRGILLDVDRDGVATYTLPPPMAGFFEFSLMRYRKDIDQKELARLFYQYMNVEEDFIKSLFADGETQLGRVFVHEPALSPDSMLQVLDYERAGEVIESASHIAVGVCYCRHKMEHVGRSCAAPLDICMTFNASAESLIRHGVARRVDKKECRDLLQQAYGCDLVQFGENVQHRVNFICNCCGCCCEALIAARRFGLLNPVCTTNFIPEIESDKCNGCGKCVEVCPVEALGLYSANDPRKPRIKKALLNSSLCLGCGLCAKKCAAGAVALKRRKERVITPVDSVHRTVLMAIERGKLQHLIFDNRALWNHRAMAAILGVVLKLPPAKQILASSQVKSRYLVWLLSKLDI